MRMRRCALVVMLLIAAGLVIGCTGGDRESQMKNYQAQPGPEVEKALKTKGGRIKELPPEDPAPKAPPLNK